MTDLPDEDTIRVRRRAARIEEAEAPSTDETVTDDRVPDETVPAETTDPDGGVDGTFGVATVPAEADSADAAPVRRRSTYIGPAADGEESDGSTIVARRESRRRAAREQSAVRREPAPVPAAPAPSGRGVSPPDAPVAAVYGARHAHPVVASRVAPPTRSPQAPVDGDASAARRRHRARRTAAIVVIAASTVALAAAASLIALTLMP